MNTTDNIEPETLASPTHNSVNSAVDSSQEVSNNQDSEESILQAFDTSVSSSQHQHQPAANRDMTMTKPKAPVFIALAIVAVVAGIGTGYGGFKLQTKATSGAPAGAGSIQQVAQEGSVKVGDVFGVNDESTFKDSTDGYLEIGGLNGEGSHKLLRPGGPTQTVYLTSSITDLDKFDGMEIKIWGETFKGQKAGWLMDVGRVEIIAIKGEKPVGN